MIVSDSFQFVKMDKGAFMKFIGIRRVFSTKSEQQYQTIGLFWDEMSKLYGRDNLMGLGCNYREDSVLGN